MPWPLIFRAGSDPGAEFPLPCRGYGTASSLLDWPGFVPGLFSGLLRGRGPGLTGRHGSIVAALPCAGSGKAGQEALTSPMRDSVVYNPHLPVGLCPVSRFY